MARKRYMEEAERVMLLMYSVYYNETGQIANSYNLKGAMTRGRNFAQAAIDGDFSWYRSNTFSQCLEYSSADPCKSARLADPR